MNRKIFMLGMAWCLFGCTQPVNSMSTEELIFEKSPYIEAAQAAARGPVGTLEQLLQQGLNPNHVGRETRTPWGKDNMNLLLWATLSENLSGAQALLKAGADPNQATRRGLTPLMIAGTLKEDALFELLLVQYRADPNKIFGRPYETALTFMLQEYRNLGEKRFERARRLLQSGADVNLNLDRGDTALSNFGRLGDWRNVYWLLEHGANYEMRDSVKATLMCSLRRSYRVNTLAPSEAYTYRDKVRDWLLARGVARSRVDPALHPDPKCDD